MKIGGKNISLKSLETFEVAARKLHFGQAAAELNITQSAISHQIKNRMSSLLNLRINLATLGIKNILRNPAGAATVSVVSWFSMSRIRVPASMISKDFCRVT